MSNILIIEDDVNKSADIRAVVLGFSHLISLEVSIIEKRSYHSGLSEILQQDYDLVLLDMTLPTFDITHNEDGFKINPFAGRDILAEMKRKRRFIPVVVVTMFETLGNDDDFVTLSELNCSLEKEYNEFYTGFIYYNSSVNNWRDELSKKLDEALS